MTQTRSPRSGEAPVSTSSSPGTLSTASERARMKIPTGTSFASDHRFGVRAGWSPGRRVKRSLAGRSRVTSALSANAVLGQHLEEVVARDVFVEVDARGR